MKKLIIFDLDGVLVDACEWHRLALNRALKEVCNYEISLQDHYSDFNGLPTKVKLQKLTKLGIVSPVQHEKVNNLKQKFTLEIINTEASRRPEKIKMINHLKENGCIVACFTNSIRRTAQLMLEKTGVLDSLDKLLTNEDVENPKPSPEGYNFLVNHFNFDKENVIIVEDSPKGVQAAIASGCKVLVVKNPDEVDISLFKEHLG